MKVITSSRLTLWDMKKEKKKPLKYNNTSEGDTYSYRCFRWTRFLIITLIYLVSQLFSETCSYVWCNWIASSWEQTCAPFQCLQHPDNSWYWLPFERLSEAVGGKSLARSLATLSHLSNSWGCRIPALWCCSLPEERIGNVTLLLSSRGPAVCSSFPFSIMYLWS